MSKIIETGEQYVPPCVLVIEDQEISNLLYKKIANMHGYELVSEQSVEDALIKYGEKIHRFTHLLVDYYVLGMLNGADFIRTIRKTGYKGVIIPMSSEDDRNIEMMEAGASIHLGGKPESRKILKMISDGDI